MESAQTKQSALSNEINDSQNVPSDYQSEARTNDYEPLSGTL